MAEILASLTLQDMATEWLYYLSDPPPSQPATRLTFKSEYLNNNWSDLPQIFNISSWDQTKVKEGFNEDDLK